MNILHRFKMLIGGLEEITAQVTRIVPFEHFDEFPFYEVFFYGNNRQVYRLIPKQLHAKLDIEYGDHVRIIYNPTFCHPIDPEVLNHRYKYTRELRNHKQLEIVKIPGPVYEPK